MDKLISFIWPISFLMSFLISLITIKSSINILNKTKIFDIPNERSSHKIPTPKGAGIGMIATLLIIHYAIFSINDFLFSGAIVILTLVSFINDKNQISIILRLITQVILTAIILIFWDPLENIIFFNSIIPFWLEKIIILFFIIWAINLFNFMDGIDGIAGVQCVIIGIGVGSCLYLSQETYKFQQIIAGFFAGSGLAFLLWNWHPAKVFLGDAGSIPLGFINAILMLLLCKNGLWYVVIIINNYYFADSTITLFRRIKMKQKPWQAHKDHFYQKAVQNGKSHANVSKDIAIHGIFLIALASFTTMTESLIIIILSIIISSLSTVYLLYYLNKKPTPNAKVL